MSLENDSERTALSPSLASFVSEWGEDVDESPEPDQPDAGAPPADDLTDASDPTAARSDESADAEHAGAPPAVAAEPDSDAPAVLDDPLKDATPLTYTVDGQERTVSGIKRLGDLGAIVDADYLPTLQQRLSERDHLFEAQQKSYEKYAGLEKLTEWQSTGPDGRPQVLTGAAGIEASRVAFGSALAKLDAYETLLSDPAKVAALLTYDESTGQFGRNEDALAQLAMRIENTQLRLVPKIRERYASTSAPAPTQAPAPFDATASAPQIVDYAIKQSAVTGLTPADTQWAQKLAPRYVRAATAADVRASPLLTLGEPMLEPEFIDLLRERAQLRAESAKQLSAASDIGKSNAAKLAAAAVGRRPAAPARPIQKAPTPSRAQQNQDEAWDLQENALYAGMTARR